MPLERALGRTKLEYRIYINFIILDIYLHPLRNNIFYVVQNCLEERKICFFSFNRIHQESSKTAKVENMKSFYFLFALIPLGLAATTCECPLVKCVSTQPEVCFSRAPDFTAFTSSSRLPQYIYSSR